ncbi:Integrase, catalytic core domain and Ribonuclease H-like domain-containing protein [Strongyloides ratti]|uniref:Integrase, catalytic core domain and Ribonuclease H-like domain-containing protein n=1 Tax=Strongyloides ratti TaxID=34506 RepID=A0A090L1V0_STRRB|nr:Integrase, catalytic core domain and Ribonuclease H-like domain-containing protein [Strongyloides ratti]CEF61469.1 Integrase, catalytic core domain and Ribonuclease H-like domain-containing protein [Strongyloides ratti]
MLYPSYSTSSKNVGQVYLHFTNILGRPRILKADNAQTFDSKCFKENIILNEELKLGAPYYSKSQSLVERLFGTVNRILMKIDEDKENEPMYYTKSCENIMAVLNSSVHYEKGEQWIPRQRFYYYPKTIR